MKKIIILLLILSFSSCKVISALKYNYIGNYYFSNSKYQKALKNYFEAKKYDFFSDWVSYNIGVIYYEIGEINLSLKAFGEIKNTYDPKLMHLLNFNKGVIYFKLGSYSLARQYFRNALYFDPGDLDSKRNLEIVTSKIKSRIKDFKKEKIKVKDKEIKNEKEATDKKNIFEFVKKKEQDIIFNQNTKDNYGVKDW